MQRRFSTDGSAIIFVNWSGIISLMYWVIAKSEIPVPKCFSSPIKSQYQPLLSCYQTEDYLENHLRHNIEYTQLAQRPFQ